LVENFKLNLLIFEGVGDFEKEPLGISIGVDVVLQQEIVLVIGHF
jgi:hypothetical protein